MVGGTGESGRRNIPGPGCSRQESTSREGSKIIDNLGHLIYRDGLNRGRGRLEVDRGQFETMEEVFFPSGCAALYRREMLDEVGLFDEDFFAYGDDTDLGIERKAGGLEMPLRSQGDCLSSLFPIQRGLFAFESVLCGKKSGLDCGEIFSSISSPGESLLHSAALCLPRIWRPGRPRGRGKVQRGLFSRTTSANPVAGLPGGIPGIAENVEEKKRDQKTDPGKRKRNQDLVSPFWHECPGDLLERLNP